MRTTHLTRLLLGIGLLVCAAIVLGLSTDIETIIRDHSTLVSSTSTFPYAAWVGGFTIFFEIILIICRLASPESLLGIVVVDLIWSLLMFTMWLCAAALVTIRTNACNVNFGLSSSFCSKVDATAAFLWIGWAFWLFVLFTLVYIIGTSQGDAHVLKEPIPTYEPKRPTNYYNNNNPNMNTGYNPNMNNPNMNNPSNMNNNPNAFAPITSNSTYASGAGAPWASPTPQSPQPTQAAPTTTAARNMV